MIFISCKVQKEKSKNLNHLNLIFENSLEIDSLSELSIIEMLKKISSDKMQINEYDSTEIKKIVPNLLLTKFKETPKTKINIEFKNDSIWRYTTEKDIIIGDIYRLSKNNGILNYHSKNDRNIIYRKFDLFANDDKYIIEKHKKITKKIMNYDCYYVKITKIENDIEENNLGNTIYEMYVTENIKLPIHSIINITKKFNDIFPLEIKISEENLDGFYEYYKILDIK